MMTPEENDLLCRVEGDAPMGQIMRRHWIPACLSEEVAEPDCAPLRVRLLGDDMVVFRDTAGRLGALDALCPHRRAPLYLGRNEACGLRCLYHGWKFDVAGNVLEMPSEPPASRLIERLTHKAYPVHEAGGFVWVYLGPPAEQPDFLVPPWAPTDTTRISIVKMQVRCNWAQVLEGAIDSAHSSSLHSTDMPSAPVDGAKATGTAWPRPSTDRSPKLEVQRTEWGFRYAAIRRPIFEPERNDYVRITVFIAPFTALIPPNNRYNLAQAIIPVDDTHTMFHFIAWHETDGIDQTAWRAFCAAQPGIDLGEDWLPLRSPDNRYWQDRQAMKLGSFTGIKGIPTQDMAMWEGMGPIADRSKEELGLSDLAVAQFRSQMIRAVRAFAAGEDAIGTGKSRVSPASLRSFEGIVAKGTDWRGLGMATAAAAA